MEEKKKVRSLDDYKRKIYRLSLRLEEEKGKVGQLTTQLDEHDHKVKELSSQLQDERGKVREGFTRLKGEEIKRRELEDERERAEDERENENRVRKEQWDRNIEEEKAKVTRQIRVIREEYESILSKERSESSREVRRAQEEVEHALREEKELREKERANWETRLSSSTVDKEREIRTLEKKHAAEVSALLEEKERRVKALKEDLVSSSEQWQAMIRKKNEEIDELSKKPISRGDKSLSPLSSRGDNSPGSETVSKLCREIKAMKQASAELQQKYSVKCTEVKEKMSEIHLIQQEHELDRQRLLQSALTSRLSQLKDNPLEGGRQQGTAVKLSQKNFTELQDQIKLFEKKVGRLKEDNALLKSLVESQKPVTGQVKVVQKRNTQLVETNKRLEEKLKNTKHIHPSANPDVPDSQLKKIFAKQRVKDRTENAKAMMAKDGEIAALKKHLSATVDSLYNTPRTDREFSESELRSLLKTSEKERLMLEAGFGGGVTSLNRGVAREQKTKSEPAPSEPTASPSHLPLVNKLKGVQAENRKLQSEAALLKEEALKYQRDTVNHQEEVALLKTEVDEQKEKVMTLTRSDSSLKGEVESYSSLWQQTLPVYLTKVRSLRAHCRTISQAARGGLLKMKEEMDTVGKLLLSRIEEAKLENRSLCVEDSYQLVVATSCAPEYPTSREEEEGQDITLDKNELKGSSESQDDEHAFLSFNAGDYLFVFGEPDGEGFYSGRSLYGYTGSVHMSIVKLLGQEDFTGLCIGSLGKLCPSCILTPPEATPANDVLAELSAELMDVSTLSVGSAVVSSPVIGPVDASPLVIGKSPQSNAGISNEMPETNPRLPSQTSSTESSPKDADSSPTCTYDNECPYPTNLRLERQLSRAVYISWGKPASRSHSQTHHEKSSSLTPRGKPPKSPRSTRRDHTVVVGSGEEYRYCVYVDGIVRYESKRPTSEQGQTVLLDAVDSRVPHRVSVIAVGAGGTSDRSQCTIVIGKVSADGVEIQKSASTCSGLTVWFLPINSNNQHALYLAGNLLRVLRPGVVKVYASGLDSSTEYNVDILTFPPETPTYEIQKYISAYTGEGSRSKPPRSSLIITTARSHGDDASLLPSPSTSVLPRRRFEGRGEREGQGEEDEGLTVCALQDQTENGTVGGANRKEALTFVKGDFIKVYGNKDQSGYYLGEVKGQFGFVHESVVRPSS